MKRLFIVASLAIAAIGCQKTEVQNLVTNEIGFNTEVGKQTRAIVNDTDVVDAFGVYAWGHQGETSSSVMSNVQVSKDGVTTGKYYWPNDEKTTLNFYAYSPYDLPVTMAVEGTMTLNSYEHKQADINKVDFMVATPVKNATYAMPDGQNTAADNAKGIVPITFNHEMTQVIFKASTNVTGSKAEDGTITGVIFTLKSIKLKNIANKSTYSSVTNPKWTNTTDKTDYVIYSTETGVRIPYVSETNAAEPFVSVAATMIPQSLVSSVENTPGHQIEVVYDVVGQGVATETVTKVIDLKTTTLVAWNPNYKVVYNLTVGLKEISFEPSVAGWDDGEPNDQDDFVNVPAFPLN